MLSVSEIFSSIQGESIDAGLPCVFVRLTGCNLRCKYCDTRYAWENGKDLTVPTIVKRVLKYKIPLAEITGGEPLLQPDAPRLARALQKEKIRVLVETNGSLDVSVLPRGVVKIMDVKCPDSGAARTTRWKNLEYLRSADQLKFVIGTRADFAWAVRTVRHKKLGDRFTILFSPVANRLRPATLADWMVKDPVPARLQLQLHKIIWPRRKRGV